MNKKIIILLLVVLTTLSYGQVKLSKWANADWQAYAYKTNKAYAFKKIYKPISCSVWCNKIVSYMSNEVSEFKGQRGGAMGPIVGDCYTYCLCKSKIAYKKANDNLRKTCKARNIAILTRPGVRGESGISNKFIWWNPLTWF